jgi:hypothetical protein
MPKGPSGQKRPADAVGCAVLVGKIATGEVTENPREPTGKVRSGIAGAKARAASMTPEQRSENARRAAAGRWG